MIWRRRKARSPRPLAGARVTLQGDHLAGIIIDEGGEMAGTIGIRPCRSGYW